MTLDCLLQNGSLLLKRSLPCYHVVTCLQDTHSHVVMSCSYDPRWDPDYACVGGQWWNACGSPCIRTCHYRPDPEVRKLQWGLVRV